MPNVIRMTQIDQGRLQPSQDRKQEKKELKKIELATLIQSAPAPYEKTKILRIVQRYVLVNQLRQPFVVKEPNSSKARLIRPGESKDFIF